MSITKKIEEMTREELLRYVRHLLSMIANLQMQNRGEGKQKPAVYRDRKTGKVIHESRGPQN